MRDRAGSRGFDALEIASIADIATRTQVEGARRRSPLDTTATSVEVICICQKRFAADMRRGREYLLVGIVRFCPAVSHKDGASQGHPEIKSHRGHPCSVSLSTLSA